MALQTVKRMRSGRDRQCHQTLTHGAYRSMLNRNASLKSLFRDRAEAKELDGGPGV
jgi:hypothetical protein